MSHHQTTNCLQKQTSLLRVDGRFKSVIVFADPHSFESWDLMKAAISRPWPGNYNFLKTSISKYCTAARGGWFDRVLMCLKRSRIRWFPLHWIHLWTVLIWSTAQEQKQWFTATSNWTFYFISSTLFDFKINNLCLVHKYRPNTVDELSNFEPSFVSLFLVPLKCIFIYTLPIFFFFFYLTIIFNYF